MRRCRRRNSGAERQPAEHDRQRQPAEAMLGHPLEAVDRRQHRAPSDSATLGRSMRPASGSRYSGSSRGPTTSSSTITGTATRNTEPHQKNSSSTPPTSGPIAAPAEKLAIHTPMANWRWCASWNMLRISDSVDGASVAPATPSSARVAISISALSENAASDRGGTERRGADQQQPAPTDAVAERAHGDQEAGDQEAVDVDDPQQLRRRRRAARG